MLINNCIDITDLQEKLKDEFDKLGYELDMLEWHKIWSRELTDEEKEEMNYEFFIDGDYPEEGLTVIIWDGYNFYTDSWYDDWFEEYDYFETKGESLYWCYWTDLIFQINGND